MFAINWEWKPGETCYVSDLGSRKPFTEDIHEAKHWKTQKNAERYLSLKDPQWASKCQIVPVPQVT
jgi:hypothetical protein